MTNTAKHTPGPWRIRENSRHSQDECHLTICGDIFQLADINGPQYAHQIANANLIAAAPELLAALREYRSQFGQALECNGIPYGQAQLNADIMAQEAIAKATGQQVSA